MMARRGFTLIELLIVVAIIAILTAASMAMITGPLHQRIAAESTQEAEGGAATFFSTLIQDAHEAETLETSGTQGFALTGVGSAGSRVEYVIHPDGRLARQTTAPLQAWLMRNMAELSATPETSGPLYRIRLTGAIADGAKATRPFSREMLVVVGRNNWMGAQP